MNNFRELSVWQKAVDIATKIYEVTDQFPKREDYGITSQLRRSAVSISSNIAEGAGRRSKKEFRQFLDFATGSCYELETQLTISKNLNYINDVIFEHLKNALTEIQKMLYALIKTLEI